MADEKDELDAILHENDMPLRSGLDDKGVGNDGGVRPRKDTQGNVGVDSDR